MFLLVFTSAGQIIRQDLLQQLVIVVSVWEGKIAVIIFRSEGIRKDLIFKH